MVTEIKRERLEMMKEIYEGRGKIKYLKDKFGEVSYNKIIKFLQDEQYIKDIGEMSGLYKPYENHNYYTCDYKKLSWESTTKGSKYYEEELEKTNMNNNPISIVAQNGNVAVNSPNANQSLEINKNELTPEVLKILKELKKAIEDKDEKKKETLLKKIKNGSESIFWSLVANGITAVVQSQIAE